MGYYDALRMLYGLEGKIYYIEQNQEECYYLKQLIGIQEEVLTFLLHAHKLEPKAGLRGYMEVILPLIAAELKLGNDWNYKTLYLSMLEASARLFRIGKYRVYAVDELQTAVAKKAKNAELSEVPAFVRIILDR